MAQNTSRQLLLTMPVSVSFMLSSAFTSFSRVGAGPAGWSRYCGRGAINAGRYAGRCTCGRAGPNTS